MLEQMQKWYWEAASLYGDNLPKIESYVAEKLGTLSAADRAQIDVEFSAFSPRKNEPIH